MNIRQKWDHVGVTKAILTEARRRNLDGITVSERGDNFGSGLGVNLLVKKSKGLWSFKKSFKFELILRAGEIEGYWVTTQDIALPTREQIFRLPISDENISNALNMASIFIAAKT